jgi:molecular chaperone GrpE (heat shock protein)
MTEQQEIFTSEIPRQIMETEAGNVTIEASTPTAESLEIKAIAASVAEILSLIRASNRKDEINKELHEELQSYKSGLRRNILSSVLKNIIRWHEIVSEQYNYYKKQKEENADFAALFPVLLKEYKNLADGLENLLYDYDIEVEMPNVGEDFNPRIQERVRTIPTDDAEMEHKIAECINVGFRDTATDRLLKHPEVVVFQKSTEI